MVFSNLYLKTVGMKLDYLFAKLLYPESKELPDIDLCTYKFNKKAF